MSTQINQKILTEFSLRTLDIDDINVWENDFKSKLFKLLTINNIDEFIYRNYIQKGEVKYLVTIIGSVRNNQMAANIYLQATDTLDKLKSVQNKPKTIQLSFGDAIPPMYINESVIVNINNSKVYNQSPTFLTIKIKGSDYWILYDRNIDAGFVTKDIEDIRSRTQPNTAEYRQVYNELDEAIRKQQQRTSVYYESAKEAIQARLSDPFYKDVKLGITLRQMGSERTEHFTTSSEGSDIELDITIGTSGSVTIQHSVSEGYLSEYVPKWQQEVDNRGLTEAIDVEVLRREVIAYFTSEALEKSMWQRFIQYVDAKVGKKVGGYVEAIQATQKVTQHVWEKQKLPESLWYITSPEYKNWPDYLHPAPTVAGATDGIIDEITGLPMACIAIYDIATDKKQREALASVFTADGFKQILTGLQNEANEILNDKQKLEHFAGKTTVAVAFMITGYSIFTKGGKIKEVVDKSTSAIKRILSPKVTKILDNLKQYFKYEPDKRKIFNEYVEKLDDTQLNEVFEEVAEDSAIYGSKNSAKEGVESLEEQIKKDPSKFIQGKNLETNVTARITKELADGGGKYLDNLAETFGVNVEELSGMQRLTQLQIHLPKGGWSTLDDVFVKVIIEDDVLKGYKIYVNETKLSKLAPMSNRQDDLLEALLDDKITKFATRSKTPRITRILAQGTEVSIERWVKTIGNGVEDATDLLVEKLF